MSKRDFLSIIIMFLSILGIIAMLAVPVASYESDTSSNEEVSVHLLNGDIDMNLGGLAGKTYRWNDFYGSRTGTWPTWLVLIMIAGCIGAFLGSFLSFLGSRDQILIGSVIGAISSFLGLISAILFDQWWLENVLPVLEEEIASQEEWNYQGGGYIIVFFILTALSLLLLISNYRSLGSLREIKQFSSLQGKSIPLDSPSTKLQEKAGKQLIYCPTCSASMVESSTYCSSCGAEMIPAKIDEVPEHSRVLKKKDLTESS